MQGGYTQVYNEVCGDTNGGKNGDADVRQNGGDETVWLVQCLL